MDVGAVALEDPMGGDADEDEEIARRGSADADLAFSGETDADAILDPGETRPILIRSLEVATRHASDEPFRVGVYQV